MQNSKIRLSKRLEACLLKFYRGERVSIKTLEKLCMLGLVCFDFVDGRPTLTPDGKLQLGLL